MITYRGPSWCRPALLGCVVLIALTHTAHADLSQPGPYAPGYREVSVARPSGGSFTAVLYYPATAAGQDAPLDASGAPYPAISFGHGFFQTVERYTSTLEHLATWGYFVIATRSQGGLFPSHSQYAIDLSACLTYLEQANADVGDSLFGLVATDRFGMSGHSMGGGASILATADDARVRVLANLAAAETNPSAIDAMPNIAVPVFLIAGDDDGIVPVGSHGELMYATGNAPRQLPLIAGGFHCGFIDSWTLGCDSGALSRAEQLAITRRWLTTIFELHLREDQARWRSVWGPERDGDPLVQSTADPGATLLPAEAAVAAWPGAVATVDLTVTNTGAFSTAFALFAEDQTWPVTITPTLTAELVPGAATTMTVAVSVPAGGAITSDTALISARAERDGATRSYATVTVTRLAPCRGDANCDRFINFRDIDYFVAGMNDDVTGWAALFAPAEPPCPFANLDCNADGFVNFRDIDPFVAAQNTSCD